MPSGAEGSSVASAGCFQEPSISTPPALVPRVSPWAPLSQPVFRRLWGVWLTANICMWMNDVAAAWTMTSLTTSPAMVALVQSASTLPVFLLGLPSGALADIVDRRRYFIVTQLWVAAVGTLLYFVTIGDGMSAPLLLALTFANGIGLAMRWPVFAALIPELIPRPQLPAALALNGLAMNASRIVGPILAGALIASAGIAYVFALNAALSVAASVVVMRWKSPPKESALPGERFWGAIRVGVQHVRQSTQMHGLLWRVAVFFVQAVGLTSLLPLVARQMPGGDAGTFTLLLAAMGVGAVVAAVNMPRIRQHVDGDRLVFTGAAVQAVAALTVAFSPNAWVAVPALIIAGMAVISVANTLVVSAQLSLPNWVRARGMSIYQMALMGGSAFGAAVWGQMASFTSVAAALCASAVTGLLAMVAVQRWKPVSDEALEDMTLLQVWKAPVMPVEPSAGPVLTTIEYRIDPARAAEFRAVMQATRRSRLRQGALSCEVFRDPSVPGRYLEYMLDESWVEHLRRFDRVTAHDVSLREQRLALHIGDGPPVVSRCLAEPLTSDD